MCRSRSGRASEQARASMHQTCNGSTHPQAPMEIVGASAASRGRALAKLCSIPDVPPNDRGQRDPDLSTAPWAVVLCAWRCLVLRSRSGADRRASPLCVLDQLQTEQRQLRSHRREVGPQRRRRRCPLTPCSYHGRATNGAMLHSLVRTRHARSSSAVLLRRRGQRRRGRCGGWKMGIAAAHPSSFWWLKYASPGDFRQPFMPTHFVATIPTPLIKE